MKKILLILSLASLQLINCSDHGKSVEKKLTKEQKEEANKMLLDAALKGNLKKVQEALDEGAHIETKDKEGRTALIIASSPLRIKSNRGHKEIVKLLLEKGANVEAKNNNRRTALMFASMYGHKDIVELLIKAGADVNAKNMNSETALDYVSGLKDKEGYILKLLTTWAPYSKKYYDDKEDKTNKFKKYKEHLKEIKCKLNVCLIEDLSGLATEYLVSSKTDPTFEDWMEIVYSGKGILDEFNALGAETKSTSSSSSSSSSSK